MTSPSKEHEKEIRLYLAELNAELTKFGRNRTVPIYRAENDLRPRPLGTGFVVEVENTHFLVTAAHVVDELDNDSSLHFRSPQNKLVPIEGILNKINASDVGGRDRDRIDFAFLHLSTDLAFTSETSFAASLLRDGDEEKPMLVLLGYPASRNKDVNVNAQNIRTSLYSYLAREGDITPLAKKGINDMQHLGLNRDNKALQSVYDSEPDLHQLNGMSGGSILSHEFIWTPGARFSMNPRSISLPAMFIEDHSKSHRLLLGVRSKVILSTIYEYLNRNGH